MSASSLPSRDGALVGFLPILIANLLPLVGVLRFGWEPATLAFVYGVEVLLSLLLAAGTALFAQRPPPADREGGVLTVSNALLTAKRGSVRPVDWLPPIPLRNVSFCLTVLYTTPVYAFFLGVYLSEVFGVGWGLFGADVLLSIGGLLVGQLAEIRRRYFGRRQCERVSPYAVVETPARQVFFLIFVLGTGLQFGATWTLVAVVCAKLVLEWATYRASRDETDSSRLAGWFTARSATDDAGPDASVDVPAAAPRARVRPDRSLVVRKGILRALTRVAPFAPIALLVWAFAAFSLADWTGSSLVVPVGAVALFVVAVAAIAVQTGAYYLRYGTVEYRLCGDSIVAYDTVLEEPQWVAPIGEIREVAVETDAFDERLLGTRRLRLTVGWDREAPDRYLGPIRDVTGVADALEIPAGAPDAEPAG